MRLTRKERAQNANYPCYPGSCLTNILAKLLTVLKGTFEDLIDASSSLKNLRLLGS